MCMSTMFFWKSSLRVLLILAVLASPAFAQEPSGVMTRAVAEHGGAALQSVQTLRLTGESSAKAVSTPVVISADLDGYVRYDYGQPITRSWIHEPDGEFEIRGQQAAIIKQPHVGLFAGLDFLSILGLKRLEIGSTQWQDAGSGTDSGRAVDRRTVETAQQRREYGRLLKDTFEVRFDAQTGLVSSVSRTQYAENSLDLTFPVRYAFSDYRETQGIVFPFRIEKYVKDRLVETFTFSSIEINAGISRATFER